MLDVPQHVIKLFYCYAHEDKSFLDELEKHLSNLKRQYHITTWQDQVILPGENWEQEIHSQLQTADLILLLVSPDFMASDYCYSKEMTIALERERNGMCRVIPVILRHIDWIDSPFSHLQKLPADDRPITSWSNRDEAFWDVAVGIRAVVKNLLLKPDLGSTIEQVITSVPAPNIEKSNLNVIDLSIEAALEIGADKRQISLAELHTAYLRANPGIKKATNRDSFEATINYHTINMRSRFVNPNDKRKHAPWLSRPVFKRVAYARYMLLSSEEVILFHQLVEENDSRIYLDEYNLDDLKSPKGQR
ncbi:MAG TPA: toll/interleukin-1 receptor domain-containing protein [Ktedonobacteraceae bacterium]|nr:toll/interleukin-1 receptor domain-containing protein [Ktedonobacteraceae bacterium]